MPAAAQNLTRAQGLMVLQEYQKRSAERATLSGMESPLLTSLFPQQQAVLLDSSRQMAVRTNRRAGKTVVASNILLWNSQQNEAWDCLYLNLTGKLARATMWEGSDGLKAIDRRHEIGCHFNNADMICTLPNGGKITCSGAENKEDIELHRGLKFKLIVIDEAGSFKAHLEPLITSTLQPTTADLRGSIVLVGTPGRVLAGLFFEATREDGHRNKAWSLHTWSILDNPHIPHAAEEMQHVLEVNGWSEDHPTYQREWLGRWVRAASTLVYRYHDDGRNTYETSPASREWMHILGIDFGWTAPTAFRVISFSPDHPDVYFGETLQETKLDITDIAHVIKRWNEKYHFVDIVADAGALGVQIIAELSERHGLPVQAAEKVKKADYIEAMNDDLLQGRIKTLADDPIIPEWAVLQWEDELRRKEDPRFANHLSDATLYARRQRKHFTHVAPEPLIHPGDEGWHDQEAQRMLEADIEKFGADAEELPWWEPAPEQEAPWWEN